MDDESLAMVFEDDVPMRSEHVLARTVDALWNDIQGVDDSGNVAQDCEEDVDAEIRPNAFFERNSDGWKEDGEDDLDDVAATQIQVSQKLHEI
ncbi:MAG: hypothetical protein Q9176_000702 [Flavoplaca citrina]